MARPRLDIGTHGKIRVRQARKGVYYAVAEVRDYDGVNREVLRAGASKTDAIRRLKVALRDRGKAARDGEITPDTKLTQLGELFLAKFAKEVKKGRRSPTTLDQYRFRFERHIKPGVGELSIREASTGRLDRFITDVEEHHGAAAAKTTRTILSGMMGLAVRHDAIGSNPVRDVSTIETEKGSARSLELDEARELRGKIHASEKAQDWDLVDFTDTMLATGLRIGETAAIRWTALDLNAGTVEVQATVVRIKGGGLIIKPKLKTKSGYRTLELSRWAVIMLKARKAVAEPNEWGVVFTSPKGGLRDPSNTQADLRVIFKAAGFEWVTSHVYRKTVATLMDEAGCTARQAADQLGHAKVSMTQDNYFGRKQVNTGAAEVMEAVATPEPVEEEKPE